MCQFAICRDDRVLGLAAQDVYWVTPAYQEHFKVIWDRLISAREEALAATYPAMVSEALETLQQDGVAFYRKLCQTAGHDSPYALIPFLPAIDPKDFVDVWLASPRPAWRWVKSALEERLKPHRVQHELASEREWALEVLRLVEERRDALTGFEKLRVQRIVPSKLRSLQEEEEVAVVEAEVAESNDGQ